MNIKDECIVFIGLMSSLLHHRCAYVTEVCCSALVLSLEWIKQRETSSQGALDGDLPMSFEWAPINFRLFCSNIKKRGGRVRRNYSVTNLWVHNQNITGYLAVSLDCACLSWGDTTLKEIEEGCYFHVIKVPLRHIYGPVNIYSHRMRNTCVEIKAEDVGKWSLEPHFS